MIVGCPICLLEYDDVYRYTFCPHARFEMRSIVTRGDGQTKFCTTVEQVNDFIRRPGSSEPQEHEGRKADEVGEMANAPGLQPPFQYIVLHESCRDHPGVIAVHAAHAAGEACVDGAAPGDTRVVVLVAKDSADLVALADELRAASIPYALILETDGIRAGQATALGTGPTRDRESVRRFFPRERFKVLR